jgi:hypothetical protein
VRRGVARAFALAFILAAFAVTLAAPALAQEKKIKIGVVFDLTGPFAGGGSELHNLGAKILFLLRTHTGTAIRVIAQDR